MSIEEARALMDGIVADGKAGVSLMSIEEARALMDGIVADVDKLRALSFVPAEGKNAAVKVARLLQFLLEKIEDAEARDW